jgi:hypothetical protein
MEFEDFAAWFEAYAQNFKRGDPEYDRNIDVKLDHSRRVHGEAERILASLNRAGDWTRNARLAALFHDVGRFEQYARWQTFVDRDSANHAVLSARVLIEQKVLAALTAADRRVILPAVALHNRIELPEGLPQAVDAAVRVVRDADKIDIFRVLLEHFRPGGSKNDVVTLGLIRDSEAFSPSVLDRVGQGRAVNYQDLVYVNDFKLLLLSWIPRLNFPPSAERFIEQDYLAGLAAVLPPHPEIAALISRLDHDLKQFADG